MKYKACNNNGSGIWPDGKFMHRLLAGGIERMEV